MTFIDAVILLDDCAKCNLSCAVIYTFAYLCADDTHREYNKNDCVKLISLLYYFETRCCIFSSISSTAFFSSSELISNAYWCCFNVF